MTQFIGIDGEGKNVGDRHLYTLLCASDESYVESEAGLTYYDCFTFLLDLKRKYPIAKFVGYSTNYDVNMMLYSIPRNMVRRLWETRTCQWYEAGMKWILKWIPNKLFRIIAYPKTAANIARYGQRISTTLWDTFGFFQSSFVKALKVWGIGNEGQVTEIERMKGQRGDFAGVSSERIRIYCAAECMLLVELLNKLDTAFQSVGLKLRSYHGAGAAGASLLEHYHVKRHLQHFDKEMEDAFLAAYYGGRTEIFRIGNVRDVVHNYDINSAYPAAATYLPSLSDARFEVAQYDRTEPYAIWYVEWDTNDPILAPFPFRKPDGGIIYVSKGAGWYHAVEVNTAMGLYPNSTIVPKYGYILRTATNERPFEFLREAYDQRREMKDVGNPAEKALKLSINSVYGKLAQGYGAEDGKPPPYQSYYWAGYITAHCRANLLRAVYATRQHLVALATDGVFTVHPLTVLLSQRLGEWEHKQCTAFFSAQPGVYQCRVSSRTVRRNRGFSTREIRFDKLRQQYRKRGLGATMEYPSTRFVGYGTVGADLLHWCTWRQSTRKVSVSPGGKSEARKRDGQLVLRTAGGISAPYKPKTSWLDLDGSDELLSDLT